VFIGNMCPFILINTAAFIVTNSCGGTKLTLDERNGLLALVENDQVPITAEKPTVVTDPTSIGELAIQHSARRRIRSEMGSEHP
jgi:hypothetical protein